jgi:hypothetical protein
LKTHAAHGLGFTTGKAVVPPAKAKKMMHHSLLRRFADMTAVIPTGRVGVEVDEHAHQYLCQPLKYPVVDEVAKQLLSSMVDEAEDRSGVDVRINPHLGSGRPATGEALVVKLNALIFTVNCAAAALATTANDVRIIYYIDYPNSAKSETLWGMLAGLGYKIVVVRTKYAPQ